MEAAVGQDAGLTMFGMTDRERAVEELVDAYGDGILQLAYFYLRDRTLAEDIFQEVFTRVYTQMHTFRGESSPRTWIYRIAVNLCRDKLRSWSMRKVLLLGEELIASAAPTAPDTVDEVLAAADKAALLSAVMQLPVEYREVVLLFYYDEMSSPEVSAALGLSEGTVRSRLFRARAKLKIMLTEGGFAHGSR
jgi:RNA polymerase sigma-70 factor (ECF subfamily)